MAIVRTFRIFLASTFLTYLWNIYVTCFPGGGGQLESKIRPFTRYPYCCHCMRGPLSRGMKNSNYSPQTAPVCLMGCTMHNWQQKQMGKPVLSHVANVITCCKCYHMFCKQKQMLSHVLLQKRHFGRKAGRITL